MAWFSKQHWVNKKTNMGKVEPLKPWKCPFLEKRIIRKLTYEEMKYLKEHDIFSQANVILELLRRAKER